VCLLALCNADVNNNCFTIEIEPDKNILPGREFQTVPWRQLKVENLDLELGRLIIALPDQLGSLVHRFAPGSFAIPTPRPPIDIVGQSGEVAVALVHKRCQINPQLVEV
jgi:hypothetical protein